MRKLALVLAGTALMSGPALAADFMPAPPPIFAPAPTGFPWAGAYLGTFAEYGTQIPGFGYGVQAGYNFVRGNFLFGTEVETSHFTVTGPLVDASLVGRAGMIMRDRILIYGQAGIGSLLTAPTFSVGGGVEFAMRRSLSAFVEAKASFLMGGGGYFGTEIRAGLNYHAGDGEMGAIGGGSIWSGLYMGAVGGYWTFAGLAETGVQAGYNFDLGNMVAGFEVQTTSSTGTAINASLAGRAGFGLGDRALVYARAAVGTALGGLPYWSIGGGVEVAMGDRASVFAGVDRLTAIGGGVVGGRLSGGVNLHFGQ